MQTNFICVCKCSFLKRLKYVKLPIFEHFNLYKWQFHVIQPNKSLFFSFCFYMALMALCMKLEPQKIALKYLFWGEGIFKNWTMLMVAQL